MSKSVMLSRKDAATGRKRKVPMRTRAGARNLHAARPTARSVVCTSVRPAGGDGGAVQHPAALLEDAVDVGVEIGEDPVNRRAALDRALPCFENLRHDQLDLGDRGERLDALQLLPEGVGDRISLECRILPRLEPGGEIAGESPELALLLGTGEVFDEAPCGLRVRR